MNNSQIGYFTVFGYIYSATDTAIFKGTPGEQGPTGQTGPQGPPGDPSGPIVTADVINENTLNHGTYIGQSNSSTGGATRSYILGDSNQVGGSNNSTVIGRSNTTAHNDSLVLGRATNSSQNNHMACRFDRYTYLPYTSNSSMRIDKGLYTKEFTDSTLITTDDTLTPIFSHTINKRAHFLEFTLIGSLNSDSTQSIVYNRKCALFIEGGTTLNTLDFSNDNNTNNPTFFGSTAVLFSYDGSGANSLFSILVQGNASNAMTWTLHIHNLTQSSI